jgi:hypothetical protein
MVLRHRNNLAPAASLEGEGVKRAARLLVIPEGTNVLQKAGWIASWHVPLLAVYDLDSSPVTTETVNRAVPLKHDYQHYSSAVVSPARRLIRTGIYFCFVRPEVKCIITKQKTPARKNRQVLNWSLLAFRGGLD